MGPWRLRGWRDEDRTDSAKVRRQYALCYGTSYLPQNALHYNCADRLRQTIQHCRVHFGRRTLLRAHLLNQSLEQASLVRAEDAFVTCQRCSQRVNDSHYVFRLTHRDCPPK